MQNALIKNLFITFSKQILFFYNFIKILAETCFWKMYFVISKPTQASLNWYERTTKF